jgi:hypothetical protein
MVVFYYLCYVLYAVATDLGTIAKVQGIGFFLKSGVLQGGLPEVAAGGVGSSYPIAGSTAAAVMATLPATSARHPQIHPRDQLAYPRD